MIDPNMHHDPARPTILQGDVALVPVIIDEDDREDLRPVPPMGEARVIAHSETGHHHVVPAKSTQLMTIGERGDLLLSVAEPVAITHMRDEDRHEAQMLLKGDYVVRHQNLAMTGRRVRMSD